MILLIIWQMLSSVTVYASRKETLKKKTREIVGFFYQTRGGGVPPTKLFPVFSYKNILLLKNDLHALKHEINQ